MGGTADFNELKPVYVVAYTRNPNEDGFTTQVPVQQGVNVNGIPNGMFLAVASENYILSLLQSINETHGDAIMTVFSVPAMCFIGFNNWSINDILDGVEYWIINDFKANAITKSLVSTPSNLDGYTPRNQKLRTYPYMYVGFNPPNGSSKVFRYEDFSGGTPTFKMYSEINQNPTICLIPQNYRGQSGNSMQDMVTFNGYPTIGWITDYYNTWLAQNSEIVSLQMRQEQFNYEVGQIQGGLNMTGSALSSITNPGNLANVVSTGLNLISNDVNHDYYIKNQMAQIEKQQMLPNSGNLGGSNATLLGYDLMNTNIFTRYTIKRQFAERIDKYFDMYGYLTNTVKVPNINNRPNWNYVKTIGAIITGDIPQMDLQQIKNMFDNGITLWHNTSTFLDYSKNNR